MLPLLLALEMALRSYKRARGGLPNLSAIELLTGLQARPRLSTVTNPGLTLTLTLTLTPNPNPSCSLACRSALLGPRGRLSTVTNPGLTLTLTLA